jgi:hypothetical protein
MAKKERKSNKERESKGDRETHTLTLTSSSLLVCLPTGWCGDGACELKVEPCVHTCEYIYMYIGMRACVCVHTRVRGDGVCELNVETYIHMYEYIHVYWCACVCMCVCVCVAVACVS